MNLCEQNHLARQNRILEQAGAGAAVAVAMDCWVDWMRQGNAVRGYPKSALGFANGGIQSFDDMDAEAANYAARAVDGVYKGLSLPQRTCINIVWLGMSIRYGRVDVDAVAVDAMRLMRRGLSIRGAA